MKHILSQIIFHDFHYDDVTGSVSYQILFTGGQTEEEAEWQSDKIEELATQVVPRLEKPITLRMLTSAISQLYKKQTYV